MSYPASPREVEIIRRSQVDGRKHDVTIAIFGEPGVIVIAKPWYTHRLFRLPSGGLKPGETLEEAFQGKTAQIHVPTSVPCDD